MKGLKFLLNVIIVIHIVVMMSIYFIRCLDKISSSEIEKSLLTHFSPDVIETGKAPDGALVDLQALHHSHERFVLLTPGHHYKHISWALGLLETYFQMKVFRTLKLLFFPTSVEQQNHEQVWCSFSRQCWFQSNLGVVFTFTAEKFYFFVLAFLFYKKPFKTVYWTFQQGSFSLHGSKSIENRPGFTVSICTHVCMWQIKSDMLLLNSTLSCNIS